MADEATELVESVRMDTLIDSFVPNNAHGRQHRKKSNI